MEKNKLSSEIAKLELQTFNHSLNRLAYTVTSFTKHVDKLTEELAKAEELLNLALMIGEQDNATAEELDKVVSDLNTFLYRGVFSNTTVIEGGRISANAITTSKIAANSLTTDKIVSGSITANQIAAGSVAATRIR